ncbi:MAG: LamG domain-containing protein [Candidatus Hydrogenedentes bacterium]|nr:LamG domain-containing protein [Candidatus Hydrogenedentota bacterium]
MKTFLRLLLCLPVLFAARGVEAAASLVAHWPLTADASDASGNALHGMNHGVQFAPEGALFDGRGAHIEVPDAAGLDLGAEDFTVAAWVHTETALDDTLGDLVGKFDPATRTGLNLGFMNYHGVTTSQSNYRNLFFGVDDGAAPAPWVDCGRPGNAVYIMAMCVFEGSLYAGTFEHGKDETGHIYRYDGGAEWTDCGAPFPSNAISALAVHEGRLYAAASHYRSRGSAMSDSENTLHGGRVYRYEGGTAWTDCGKLGESEAIYGLTTFRGKLYGSSLYAPAGFFEYQGGTEWKDLGNPGGRVEALGVHDGHIYGTGFDENYAGVFRFDDPGWTNGGTPPDTTQTYSFMQYRGEHYVGSWPSGKVFRLRGVEQWEDAGRLGEEKESMGMAVYNGMLYGGTLPLGAVYRYDGGTAWTHTGQLDTTADATYRRAWVMAVQDGKLFCGIMPSGRVFSFASGNAVSYDREAPAGWVHVAAVRGGGQAAIWLNGAKVAQREATKMGVDNDVPLTIGFGQHDYFNGMLRDVRIYRGALDENAIADLAKTGQAGR